MKLCFTCWTGAAFLGPPGLGGDSLGFSPPLDNQSFLTGGGTGVVTVAIETSPFKLNDSNILILSFQIYTIHNVPMIRKDSLQAWYILSISSLFAVASGLSSIICAWNLKKKNVDKNYTKEAVNKNKKKKL